MAEMTSFAPMPSHLARFAAHVDAISSALNDAREQLEQCVATIREDKSPDFSTVPQADGPSADPFGLEGASENPALQAYDRLRKELGYALRECERGRERLLDILAPPKARNETDEEDDETDLINPNHVSKKLTISDIGAPRELSRRERCVHTSHCHWSLLTPNSEEEEKREAKERYMKVWKHVVCMHLD